MASYKEDILDQPTALQATLDGLRTEPQKGLRAFARRLAEGRCQRVVLTGMGSSLHVLQPLYLRLTAQGLTALAVETSELIHHAPALIDSRSLIVAVSQSGESAEVLRLLELAHSKAELIGVTNTPTSSLARQAEAVVLTHAGQETSVSCKTYLAALAGLCWLSDQLIADPSSAQFPDLAGAPELVRQYLEPGYRAAVDYLQERLKNTRSLFLLGRGVSLAAVYTGALIIKESARTAAEGMSSAAFRHGPLELVDERTFALVFTGSPETAALNDSLVRDIRAAGGQAECVAMGSGQSPFTLPSGPTAVLPILEILPAQMTSLALAALKGIEPGNFQRATKVTTIE